jgi:hypothetical protein
MGRTAATANLGTRTTLLEYVKVLWCNAYCYNMDILRIWQVVWPNIIVLCHSCLGMVLSILWIFCICPFSACDGKHWGQDCANNCTCTDNASNCSATDGNCTCKTGWEGANCETDIDECSVNTTICSGIANTDCHNMAGSYSCDCQSGYTKHTDGTCEGSILLPQFS